MVEADTQLNEPTNEKKIKFLKVTEPMNKKTFYKTLGTSMKTAEC